MIKKIFISHSSKDADLAMGLCDYLELNGKECFIAPRDIRPGFEYAEEIVRGIDNSDTIILLLTKDANKSPHVLREVERAVSKNIPIMICKLEEVTLSKSMEYFLMTHQWMDINKDVPFSKILMAINNKEFAEENVDEYYSETGKKVSSTIQQEDSKKKKVTNGKLINIVPLVAGILVAIVVLVLLVKNDEKSGIALGNSNNNNSNNTVSSSVIVGEIEVGDVIELGVYNNVPIKWIVLKIDEDNQSAVLIAEDIISIKAFDAAESGTYGVCDGIRYSGDNTEADTDMYIQIQCRGNNDWKTSNIRTWLNSDESRVVYQDTPPTSMAMTECKNGYDSEKGFLTNFSEEERAIILPTENTTKGNALVDDEMIVTTDYVYLLSQEELKWFDEAGLSRFARITEAAKEKDAVKWYNIYYDTANSEYYMWWLRDPVENTASSGMICGITNGNNEIFTRNVGNEGYGIRPAITIDISK